MKRLIFTTLLFCHLIYSQKTPLEIYATASDAIVKVYCFDEDSSLTSCASGVVVSLSGLVYTNFHVIDSGSIIEIRAGNQKITDITIIGINPMLDIAILKIPPGIVNPVEVCTGYLFEIGEVVYALGNPKGLEKSFSTGVISRFEEAEYQTYIQFSASISPGSSGGALLNSNGKLIGITSRCYEDGQNLNLAVAVSDFDRMIKIDDTCPSQVKLMRSLFTLCTGYRQTDDMQKYEILEKLPLIASDNKNDYEFLGRIFYKFIENERAIHYYTKAIELSPLSAELYLMRADAYSDNDSAITDYSKAIELDSLCRTAYFKRAYFWRYMKDNYLCAIDDYTKLIKLKPDDASVYEMRGDCRAETGDTSGAIEDLTQSLKLYWEDPQVYYKRGKFYYELGRFRDATDDFTAAIHLNSFDQSYYFSRAVAYSRQSGCSWLAIRDYEEVIRLDPDYFSPFNNMGWCYLSDSNFQMAEYFFKKSLNKNEFNFDSYLGLSIMSLRQGKRKQALENMAKAMKIKPEIEEGMAGIDDIKKDGYFWEDDELNDMNKIFCLMGIEKKIKTTEKKDISTRSIVKPSE